MTAYLCIVGAACAAVPAATIDYAQSVNADAWLRHPVLGEPSFDAFVHAPGNPVLRGAPPLEWPVNGFLFRDPVSGDWFIYAGYYSAGYAMGEDKGMVCIAYRSSDAGASWNRLGLIFPEGDFYFDGDTSPVKYAPDVSVVFDNGRYHLVYDYATAATAWSSMHEPAEGADNGIGYAWAERPEGPFHRTPQPVYRTSAHGVMRGKYRRAYAATIIRRSRDWLVLAMTDSGPNHSWALVGMTAPSAEGPYAAPEFLRSVEAPQFHPPLLEFYPAFTHDGNVYAPATSVALNRNYQAMFRAPIDRAHEHDAWTLVQQGNLWHSEPVENEHFGIWGQTFSGFVDAEGMFNVMFPSRDPAGMGTLNIASRPWNRPLRETGFVVSGHRGPSLTLLRNAYDEFVLDAEFALLGDAALLWRHNGPIGPDRSTSDATLHPLTLSDCAMLRITADAWRLVSRNARGDETAVAAGARDAEETRHVRIECHGGNTRISLGGDEIWAGETQLAGGAIGLYAGANSHLQVNRFAIAGDARPHRAACLYTEGILGAGSAHETWKAVEDAAFRYGTGALSMGDGATAKWNFEGTAFALWAPTGPAYGTADVLLDGVLLERISLGAAEDTPSMPLLRRDNLPHGLYALTVVAREGVVPLDMVEVTL